MHEDAPQESVYVRGAYFVNNAGGTGLNRADVITARKDKTIDFFVLDPSYKVVYSKRNNDEGIFRFNTTKSGQYTYVFSNMGDRVHSKTVTLAIHPGYDA